MIYYDDFRAFAKEHEDEIFEYFVQMEKMLRSMARSWR